MIFVQLPTQVHFNYFFSYCNLVILKVVQTRYVSLVKERNSLEKNFKSSSFFRFYPLSLLFCTNRLESVNDRNGARKSKNIFD